MATTDQQVLEAALSCLASAGAPYAVLHGADKFRSGTVTNDLDLVADVPPGIEAEWLNQMQRRGVHCVIRCRYDIDARSYFFMTVDGRGAQIDITLGSAGENRLGLRASAALASSSVGPLPEVDPTDKLLYLLVKRAWKNDDIAVSQLRDSAAQDLPELRNRCLELFAPRIARVALALLDGRSPPLPRRRPRSTATWALDRAAHPVGLRWRANLAPDDGETLRQVLGTVCVRSALFPSSPLADVTMSVRAALVARKPAAVGCLGRTRLGYVPDVEVSATTAADALEELVTKAGLLTIRRVRP